MKFKFQNTLRMAIGVCLALFSCENPGQKTPGLITLSKSEEALQLGTYFSNLESLVFEENHLIGQIDKLIVTDSLIILSDFDLLKSIKVFNKKGHFLTEKDDFGDDPMAMGYFDDVEIYQDKIYVLDGNKRRIYVLDLKLNLIEEIPTVYPASGFLINRNGIFLYHMVDNPSFPYQLSFLAHGGKELEGLIPHNPILSQSPIAGSFFVKMNDDQFVHYHPGLDSIYVFSKKRFESFGIDFGGQFIDLNHSQDLHPVERLKFYNEFEGYKQLSYGIKLGEGLLLFGLGYGNKPHYLMVDLETQKATLFNSVKNNLKPLPSNIFFNGNSDKLAWYFQSADQIEKFYGLNESKIPEKSRITPPEDPESDVLFILEY